jgi:tetratricopeptide (TPR) repeat protein
MAPTSTTTATLPSPEELKERGNAAYQAGRLSEALALYSQAAAADSTNPVYLSNKSACLFELGHYGAAAVDVDTAMRLLEGPERADDESKQAALRAKLRRRRALCTLYGGQASEQEVARLAEAALQEEATPMAPADANKLRALLLQQGSRCSSTPCRVSAAVCGWICSSLRPVGTMLPSRRSRVRCCT